METTHETKSSEQSEPPNEPMQTKHKQYVKYNGQFSSKKKISRIQHCLNNLARLKEKRLLEPEETEPVEPPEPPEPWTRRRLRQNRGESTLNRVTADVKNEISVKVEDTIEQTSNMDEEDEAANIPQEFVIAELCSVKMEREDESSDENGFMEYRPVKMEEELHLICDTEMLDDHQSPSTVQEENSILEPGEWLANEIGDKGAIERMVDQPKIFEYSKPPEPAARRQSILYFTEDDELLTSKPAMVEVAERLTNKTAEEKSSRVGPAIESIEVREEYYRTNRGRGRPPEHLRLTVQEKLLFLGRLANERENQGPKWGRPRKHPRPTEEEELTIQRERAERLANQAAEKEPQSAANQTETVKNTNRPKRGRPRKRRLTAENLANETSAQRERRLEYQRWYRRRRKPQKQRAELRERREMIKLQRLAMETDEERAARLEHKRMVALKYRESLTEEEREERLERFRMRWFLYRAQETDEQAAMRRERYRIAYNRKTEEQRITYMERKKMAQLTRRATETEEQKAERLERSKIAQRLKYQEKKRQKPAQKESVVTEQVDSTNGIFGL